MPVDTNLVDELWSEQPARPSEPLQIHPLKFAGVSSADKLASVRAVLLLCTNGFGFGCLRCIVVACCVSVGWLWVVVG